LLLIPKGKKNQMRSKWYEKDIPLSLPVKNSHQVVAEEGYVYILPALGRSSEESHQVTDKIFAR
jgi:hypothetical protein